MMHVCLFRLGKVSFRQVLNLLEYLKDEIETAPLTEALAQLRFIYRLIEKRSDLNLVSRLTVGFLAVHITTSSCGLLSSCIKRIKAHLNSGANGNKFTNDSLFIYFLSDLHF